MSKLVYDTIGLWGYPLILVITSLSILVFTEAFKMVTLKEFRNRYTLFVGTLLVSLAIVLMFRNEYFTNWYEIIFFVFFSACLAIVFHKVALKFNFMEKLSKGIFRFLVIGVMKKAGSDGQLENPYDEEADYNASERNNY